MATPLSADRMVKVLKAEGVRVIEVAGWRTNNRNHKGPWGGVNGVTIHHTAGVGPGMVSLCFNGLSTLPGPLCHAVGKKDGGVHLVGHGRANHAGTFASNAHSAVLNELDAHPRPDAAEPIDGNAHYYGIEIENDGDGDDPYPAVQYDQAVRWAAAICRAHGWSANSVIGHKEGTRRKIDPSFDMNAFRRAVSVRLEHAASFNPAEEEDMPTAAEIAEAVLKHDGVIVVPGAPATNPTWTLASVQTEILKRQDKTNATLAAQKATIDKLVETVAVLAANVGGLDPAAIVAELRQSIESLEFRLESSTV